jgi:hypothetical protein
VRTHCLFSIAFVAWRFETGLAEPEATRFRARIRLNFLAAATPRLVTRHLAHRCSDGLPDGKASGMSRALFVLWTVTPSIYPRPWLSCSRCGEPRPFRCSGKFRLNANGKRLDAWLVYKCMACDGTWNHAVIERRAARDIPPALLAGFETNDGALVRRFAFDLAALRRSAHRIEEFAEVVVGKTLLGERPAEALVLEITLAVPLPVALRLDRLLAAELGLSRNRIAAMAEAGRLATACSLNKPCRDGGRVMLDLTDEVDVEATWRAAICEAAASGRMGSPD